MKPITSLPPQIELEALAERYDTFLFDQFGVLHNGVTAYPGRRETLLTLKQQGKRIGVISNSGKRAAHNQQRLASFGFDQTVVDCVVSSGEVAWQLLAELCQPVADVNSTTQLPPAFQPLQQGASIFLLSASSATGELLPSNAAAFVDGLPMTLASRPAEATLLLIDGCDFETTLETWSDVLAPAARKGIPALCTNPDRMRLMPNGSLNFAPGQIAERYASFGADVVYIGKPHSRIYHYALDVLQSSATTTLCIGDSVEHDIAGAQAAGCHSALTRTGIHREATDSELQEEFLHYAAVPTYRI